MTPNPLLYVLGFTVVMALGTGLWKVFWWVAKVDVGERDFRAFTKEIREDIKRILLWLDPTLHEPDGDATASGRGGLGAAVSLASDKRGYVN